MTERSIHVWRTDRVRRPDGSFTEYSINLSGIPETAGYAPTFRLDDLLSNACQAVS